MLILYKPCQNVEEKTHSNSSCEANITLRLKPDIVSKENTHTHTHTTIHFMNMLLVRKKSVHLYEQADEEM